MRGPLLLRETNQQVAKQALADGMQEAQFVCECGSDMCVQTVALGLGEFQELSERGDALVLAPGHFSAASLPGPEPSPSRSE
jgi:hypothetical protein